MSENPLAHASIWKNNIFMRMFASYSVSMMGNYFDMIAIMILFGYVWQTEPILIALIPVALALPQALLSQFAGVLADKWHKVKLMMIADFLTAILTLLLLIAPNPWIALVIITLRSIVNVVHYPAQQSLIKHVVPEQHLMKAISLNGLMMQLSKVIAPFIGGSLASAASPQLCILINAIAFFISSGILLSIILQKKVELHKVEPDGLNEDAAEPTQSPTSHKPSFWQSWREGWTVVLKSRILWVSFLFFFIGLFNIQMIDIQITSWFRDIAPSRPELIGWVVASSGFGAVLMIMFLNRFEKLRSYGWLLGGGIMCIGLGFGGIGLLQAGFHSLMAMLCGVIAGLGVGLYSIGIQYIIQKHTTKENIGRVSGINSSVASLSVVIAPLCGGFLAQIFGAGVIFIAVGIICTSLGGIAVLFRRYIWREASDSLDSPIIPHGKYNEM